MPDKPRSDDGPPRKARRVRPVDDDTDDLRQPRRTRPPVALVVCGAVLACLLVVGGIVATTAVLTGRGAAERQRAEALRREADAGAAQVASPPTPANGAAGEAAGKQGDRQAYTPRELDQAAAAELGQAFHNNPVAAKQKYATVRWRLRESYVHDFFGESSAVMGGGHTQATIHFRPGELAKLKRNQPHVIEAVCDDYSNTAAGPSVSFTDAVVVR